MNEAFQKLDPEKQRRIWDAVLREFAQNGYANASTNRMVQQADIGKGMLFYYFNSKEELFRRALAYSLDYLHREYVSKLDYGEPDFITRFVQITELKMRAYLHNPLPFAFLANPQVSQDAKLLAPDLLQRLEDLARSEMGKLWANVDTSLFRDDVPIKHAMNLIRWSLEGYRSELLDRLQDQNLAELDWQPYVHEFYEFLGLLRKVLYKEGDHGHSQGQ
ncbi:MAG TPA: TetR/AcrR family transcriptional regulator [Limnochordia bacterium]|nr:TetR/AcrR family transcriptional regulator [Limnochordia bacterium]